MSPQARTSAEGTTHQPPARWAWPRNSDLRVVEASLLPQPQTLSRLQQLRPWTDSSPLPPSHPGEPEVAQRADPERAPLQRGLSDLVGRLPHLLHLQEQLAQGLELDLR